MLRQLLFEYPYLCILLVKVLSPFVLIVKASFMPSHAFPDWQECTGSYRCECFGNFQLLGCQPGSKISYAVSLRNWESTAGMAETQQVIFLFYAVWALLPYTCTCNVFLPTREGMTWCESPFVIGVNELNALTESMYHWSVFNYEYLLIANCE